MAGETSIGPKIEIVGQAEFKRSLAEIERGFKVNQSEIAKVTAEYDKNDKSMQALTARNEALQKAIYTQTERVETLKAALNESAREYGESDKRTLSWQTQLNNAEAALITMNKNLVENEAALEESKKTTDGLKFSNELLTQSISEQQSKISELKKGLAENAAQYGENDQRTLYFKDALDKAQTELDGMNKDLSDNERALKGAEAKTDSLGDAIRGLADVVGLDIPPALNGMVTKLEGVNKSAAILVGTLGGVVVGLGKLTLSTASSIGEVDELAHKTGLSA